jgi:predicted permease
LLCQNIFFDDPFESNLTAGLSSLADATVPLIVLVLGANMYSSWKSRSENHVPKRVLWGITGFRLVVAPLVSLAMFYALFQVGMFPSDDPLFAFIMLLEGAMPSAMNLILIHQMLDRGQEQVAFYCGIFCFSFGQSLEASCLFNMCAQFLL